MSVRSNGGWCNCSIIFRMDRSAAANLQNKQTHRAHSALPHAITGYDARRSRRSAASSVVQRGEGRARVLYLLRRLRHSVLAQVFLHDGQVVACHCAPRLEC